MQNEKPREGSSYDVLLCQLIFFPMQCFLSQLSPYPIGPVSYKPGVFHILAETEE